MTTAFPRLRQPSHRAPATGSALALLVACAFVLLLVTPVLAPPALAGGALEHVDITDAVPSPIPGELLADVVPIRWDERCMPVPYRVDDLDPIPNPLGAPLLDLDDVVAAFETSMDTWRDIPTSFIDQRVVGTVTSPGPTGFDTINELSFQGGSTLNNIALSHSISLISDFELTDGLDMDGDGDSDVVAGLATCTDVDGDGDVEFPAGFYEAGTILDNDIRFDASRFRFTVDPAAADTSTASVDLIAVAVHELGHGHGLAHVLDNLIGRENGTGSTMFPFIDLGDPASELAVRHLAEDDRATSSLFYPEGTTWSGPAALQSGDVPFAGRYGVIEGEITDGDTGLPVAGASVTAVDYLTGERLVSAYSGRTRVSYDPVTASSTVLAPEHSLVDGRYVLPVPFGLYRVAIEASDGRPVPASRINQTARVGSALGQHDFLEEFWNGSREGAIEDSAGFALPVTGVPGFSRGGIDLTTNVQNELAFFGSIDFVGFTGAAPGNWYAVRIPGDTFLEAVEATPLLHGAQFFTFQFDASVVPLFAEASIVTGRLRPDGSAELDLDRPLAREAPFLGADGDFAPLWLKSTRGVSRKAVRKLERSRRRGGSDDLFVALRLPLETPFPGVSGLPLTIGLDGGVPSNDSPIFGLSYVSVDGGQSFLRNDTFNFLFSLVLSEEP